MDRWKQYLLRNHSQEELTEWALRLNFFRFCRAFGGHANDGDQLLLALAYDGREDLEILWRDLGISRPELGMSTVAGIPVAVSESNGRVLLSISGTEGTRSKSHLPTSKTRRAWSQG